MTRLHRNAFAIAAVLALGAMISVPSAESQERRGYPYSIMTEEPGTRAARPSKRPPAATRRALTPKAEAAAKRRRGSSSPSPVPPYESVVKPPNAAPRVIEQPRLSQPDRPSQIVPGVSGNAGPAITPPRPHGQGFQDRTLNCVHSGGTQGVGAGQIGAFTRSCVNQ